jgi:hypothetical protein
VGGLYRDQGLEVVRKWLISVVQPHVKAAYERLRDGCLPKDVLRPRVPTTYVSPPWSESALSSSPARDPSRPHRSLPPGVNVPQQGSGRGGGVECHEDMDQSRRKRRRRRSSPGDGRSGDSGSDTGRTNKRLAWDGCRHRSQPPGVNVPLPGSGRVERDVESSEGIDQSRSNRQRRLASQGGRNKDSDGTWSPHVEATYQNLRNDYHGELPRHGQCQMKWESTCPGSKLSCPPR